MDIRKRLFRSLVTTVLWFLIIVLMTGFLTVGSTLYYSSETMTKRLDEQNTAIAVRTDPEVLMDGYIPTVERRFTSEDVAALEALDSVKAVRNHTLTGGFCESFFPVTDTDKYMNWRSPGALEPYYDMVLSGTVLGTDLQENSLLIGVRIEDALLINRELQPLIDVLNYVGSFVVEMDVSECPEAAERFTVGDRYVFSGPFDPRDHEYNPRFLNALRVEGFAGMTSAYLMNVGRVFMKDGVLCGVPAGLPMPSQMPAGEQYIHYSYPVAEKLSGNAEDFFDAAQHPIWRDLRDAWQRQNHTLPVIGTDRLESMFVFVRGEATIIDGRSFTEEEYTSGAKAVIISERIASRGELSVGDRITIRQCLCAGDANLFTNPSTAADRGRVLRNPNIDLFDMNTEYADPEEFEIVGIYRLQADWSQGTYAINPNAVFIPRAAQLEGAFGTIPDAGEPSFKTTDIYGFYLSVELNNGSVENFRLAMTDSPYTGQLYTFDQGFETVYRNLDGLSAISRWLFYIAVAGWLLLLMMFLLMYQARQKHNLGVLLSLGAEPRSVVRYLAGSGGLVALAGVCIGAVVNEIVMGVVQSRILEEMLRGVDATLETAAMMEKTLTELIAQSIPGLSTHLMLAGCQLILMLIFIVIQAVWLSKQNPRALLAS